MHYVRNALCLQASPLMSIAMSALLLAHSDANVSYGSWRLPVVNIIAALVWLLCALVANARNRQRAHAWLKRVTMSDEARTAAVIAAMVGGRRQTHESTLEVARQAFRAVPFDRLVESDFGHCDMGALSDKAVPLSLGGCDAFLSHSWRDPAGPKWEALSKWCAAFAEREMRTPTIWLDKVTPGSAQPRWGSAGVGSRRDGTRTSARPVRGNTDRRVCPPTNLRRPIHPRSRTAGLH